MTEQADCWIRSTLDDQGRAACLLQWGPLQALLTIDQTRATVRDLMAAATGAETDIALIDARRPTPRETPALRIAAVAGAKTGKPFVQIGRGSMSGQLTPDEARTMALHWIEAATAAAIDVRLRYALGEWDRLDITEIEELFTLLQKAQGADEQEGGRS